MSSIKAITLSVKNMTCVNCEITIERELSKADGVLGVEASYSKGMVKITYDEAFIHPDEMMLLLEQHDYHAEPWKENRYGKNSHQNSNVQGNVQNSNTVNRDGALTNITSAFIILFALYLLANHFGVFNIIRNFPVAKTGMGYGMLFLIGVLTSVHCVAMCGGICLSQTMSSKNTGSIQSGSFVTLRPSLFYNLGRVISYTVIGGTVGALGSVVSFSGTMKGAVQLLAGIFMIIMGLNMLNIFPWLRRLNPRIPKLLVKKLGPLRGRSNSPLYIGLLNGLMPCGPLQAMQLYALSTGSPVKGAISMFLFSIGTVPLMFLFGALGSLLNKKYTKKMMTVSAVLVIFLGVFMLQNGIGLSGLALPVIPSFAGNAVSKEANVAKIENGIQVVTTGLESGRYEPIIVQKGIPIKWIIQAQEGDINGCNNSIVIPKYNLQKDLAIGDNMIEFTASESGTVPFSCWMGMIRSKITVVDDLSNIDSSTIADSGATVGLGGGSCCTGGSTQTVPKSTEDSQAVPGDSGNNAKQAPRLDGGFAGGSCCQ
jgi:sulfite exporter TauE/SafE/copper chaperone CopZ